MKNFLLLLQNQKLFFSFKFPFNLAAEPPTDPVGDEAETLTYPKVWTWAESNCRLYNANVAYCHYTTGPFGRGRPIFYFLNTNNSFKTRETIKTPNISIVSREISRNAPSRYPSKE